MWRKTRARCCGEFKNAWEMDENVPGNCKECVANGNIKMPSIVSLIQKEEMQNAELERITECV